MNAQLAPIDDPLQSLREQADAFADAEMERLFPDSDAAFLLDAVVPAWFTLARERIADTKLSELCHERDERAGEAKVDQQERITW